MLSHSCFGWWYRHENVNNVIVVSTLRLSLKRYVLYLYRGRLIEFEPEPLFWDNFFFQSILGVFSKNIFIVSFLGFFHWSGFKWLSSQPGVLHSRVPFLRVAAQKGPLTLNIVRGLAWALHVVLITRLLPHSLLPLESLLGLRTPDL